MDFLEKTPRQFQQGKNKTVALAIGNADNKLSQYEWARFDTAIMNTVYDFSERIFATTYALSNSEYQNAVFLFSIKESSLDDLRKILSATAIKFNQDEIAILVGETEMVKANVE